LKEYKMIIVENSFSPSTFKYLEDKIMDRYLPWYYGKTAYENGEKYDKYNYSFMHAVHDGKPTSDLCSPLFTAILTALDAQNIEVETLIRIRLGMITSKEKYHIDTPHVDWPFPHKTGLIYVNDSDGDTLFYNEMFKDIGGDLTENQSQIYYNTVLNKNVTVKETVTPKANKMVIFDGWQYHSSTNPVDTDRRVVINFNFIEKTK